MAELGTRSQRGRLSYADALRAAVPDWWSVELPDYVDVAGELVGAVSEMEEAAARRTDALRGPQWAVLSQMVTATFDLFVGSCTGRGASAGRAARTLIELAATYAEVQTPETADRYWAYRSVVDDQMSHALVDVDRLPRKVGSALRHRRRRQAAESRDDLDAAIDQYGPRFARSWRPGPITDALQDAGLEDVLPYWRAVSGTVHGTAAGAPVTDNAFSDGTMWLTTHGWGEVSAAFAHGLYAVGNAVARGGPPDARTAVEAAWSM